MHSHLLSTKLFIPEPRQRYIIRRSLLEQLDGGLSRKLTLVAAPPGYGKSTLLSIWIKERDFPTAWLSLDAEDNDGLLFIRYLIAALQKISPEIGQISLALLKSTQTPSPSSILSALLNDLAQIERDFTLVLDDYHSIENQEVHDSLTYLLDHLPPHMHLFIASRSDPPLALSRLRARNQLLEIRQADLRLTPEEAQQFLKQSMSLDLSDDQIAQLESRTEGWIAGLQFAGLSLTKHEDKGAFLDSFGGSHRFVIDYLADEVLSKQPEEIQAFLRQIAVLDRFSAPLCDMLTGRKDSQHLLSLLEDSNLFLIPLDEQRNWYRFHHLFLDYLRSQLDDQLQATLHVIAAEWFMTNNLYPEAVKQASASGDNELLITAITNAAKGAFEGGEISSLSSWLNSLPEKELMSNSQLATYKGLITFFSENPAATLPYAQAAQKNLPQDASSSLQGQLMSLQAHLALYQGDLERGINLSRDALEYLEPDDLFFRNLTLNVLGQILEIRGDVSAAAEIYKQAFISGHKADDQLGTLVVFTNLIFSLNELGDRNQALTICEEFAADQKWCSSAGLDLSAGVFLPWSLLSYEANQLDLAQEQVQRALQGLELVNVAQGKLWGLYILASIHLANHDYDQLVKITAQGRDLASSIGAKEIHYSWFEALEAQANLINGDLLVVERWAESRNFSPLDTPQHWFEQQYFTYVRLLITQKRFADARNLLNSMQSSALAGQRKRKLITINLLQALTESASEQQTKVSGYIEKALEYVVQQDYRQAFLNEGQALLDLLPAARHFAPEFIDALLADHDPYRDSSTHLPQPYEALSERELEVLSLVARGYSNRQIAEALFISLGTVKKHLNNIFGKLQVKNRTQAVIQARELDLID